MRVELGTRSEVKSILAYELLKVNRGASFDSCERLLVLKCENSLARLRVTARVLILVKASVLDRRGFSFNQLQAIVFKHLLIVVANRTTLALLGLLALLRWLLILEYG